MENPANQSPRHLPDAVPAAVAIIEADMYPPTSRATSTVASTSAYGSWGANGVGSYGFTLTVSCAWAAAVSKA